MRASTLIACLLALAATGPVSAAKPHPGAAAPAAAASAAAPVLVDINKADRATLKTLPGVGDAEADQIVASRPYKTKAELVTKQALPMGVFLNIKRQVTVQLKPAAPAKGKAKAQAKKLPS